MAETTRTPATSSRRLVLVVMCVGYFLVLLDVTAVNVALPQIGSGTDAGVTGLQWVVDGYALGLAALLLAGGTIGDRRGHKRVVLIGLAVFGVASLGCGSAPDTAVLVGARVVQGVGAALLLPGTLAIITRTFTGRGEQARAIGIWAGVGSAALAAGPLLGGGLVDTLGWRAVFLVNVPIVVVAGLVAARVVPESPVDAGSRFDRAGVVLAGLLLASVTFGIIEAGHSGLGARVYVAFGAAAALLVAFVAVEAATPDPMLPLGLFRRPDFATANAVAGTMNFGTLGMLFLLTLFLQSVQHRSALASGLAVLPLFLPLTLLAPAAGRATARYGPRFPMALGLGVAACGLALVPSWSAATGYAALPGLLTTLLAWGVGLGILTPAVVAAAVRSVDPERAGLASGVNNTSRQAGGAFGIAAFGAIAGTPVHRAAFVAGLHTAGAVTAALFVTAAVASVALIPSVTRRRTEVSSAQNR